MGYPPLRRLNTEADYRRHFEQKYCVRPLLTHDGIRVRFVREDFDHAFFESSSSTQPDKSLFSLNRAERIDWIEATLQDGNASLHCGWDSSKKREDPNRRVAIGNGDYVVVIQTVRSGNARFITAFPASNSTVQRISGSRQWQQPQNK